VPFPFSGEFRSFSATSGRGFARLLFLGDNAGRLERFGKPVFDDENQDREAYYEAARALNGRVNAASCSLKPERSGRRQVLRRDSAVGEHTR
jgi:hypothetical protein